MRLHTQVLLVLVGVVHLAIVGYTIWWAINRGRQRRIEYTGGCLPNQKTHLYSQNVKLRILERDWVSHGIVAHVAAILLREELRYDVEVVKHTELPLDARSSRQDYKSLARDLFDANLEIWPSGKEDEYRAWVTKVRGDSVHAGDHTAFSYYGMYTPKYLGDPPANFHFFTEFKRPEVLEEYKAVGLLQGTAAGDPGKLCNEPEWNCTADLVWRPSYCVAAGSHTCATQLLRGQSWYDTGLLEQRIEANGLNMSVLYTSFDEQHNLVWDAYAEGKRFVFYNWEPNTPILGLGADSFRRVQFRPRVKGSPGCDEPTATPVNGTQCDDPPRLLQKVISRRWNEATDAAYFVRAFQLTQQDYQQLFEQYEASSGDPYVAACQWLLRTGPDRWESWIKYTHTVDFLSTMDLESGCWPAFWAQASLLIICMISCSCVDWNLVDSCRCLPWPSARREPEDSDDDVDRIQSSNSMRKVQAKKSYTAKATSSATTTGFDSPSPSVRGAAANKLKTAGTRALAVAGVDSSATKFRNILKSRRLGFFSFRREVEHFIRTDGVCHIPERGQSNFRVDVDSDPTIQLLWYLLSTQMKFMLARTVQYTLFVGAMGTFVFIFNENVKGVANAEEMSTTMQIGVNMSQVTSTLSVLTFFLLVFKVHANSTRWSTWLGLAGSVQGRLGDLALIIGALQDPNDKENKREAARVRKLQFEFYRYLNAVHCLGYFGLDKRLPADPIDMCDRLRKCGLLVEGEEERLVSAVRGDMHVTMLTWISVLWHKEVEGREAAGDNHPNSQNFMAKLQKLRTAIASLRAASDFEREPDITNAMLVLVTYILLMLNAVAFPCHLYAEYTGCLQYWSMLMAFFFTLAIDGLLTMQHVLSKSPFDPAGDCVNTDYLICGMEEVIFYMIRASYMDSYQSDPRRPSALLFSRPAGSSSSSLMSPRRLGPGHPDQVEPIVPASDMEVEDCPPLLEPPLHSVVPCGP